MGILSRESLIGGFVRRVAYVLLAGACGLLLTPFAIGLVGFGKSLRGDVLLYITSASALLFAYRALLRIREDVDQQLDTRSGHKDDHASPPFRFRLVLCDSAVRGAVTLVLCLATALLSRPWLTAYVELPSWKLAPRFVTIGSVALALGVWYGVRRNMDMAYVPPFTRMQDAVRRLSQLLLVYIVTAGTVWGVSYLVRDVLLLPDWASAPAGLLAGVVVWPLASAMYFRAKKRKVFHEGIREVSVQEATREAQKHISWRSPVLTISGVRFPAKVGEKGIMMTGVKGSGKTLFLKCVADQALVDVGCGKDTRAVFHESKGDILPYLHALAEERVRQGRPRLDIKIFNPRHPGCVGWDMCTDIGDDLLFAAAIAEAFIPPNPHSNNPFFEDAARTLMLGMMESYILTNIRRREAGSTEYRWTLRHVLLAMRSTARMREVLARHAHTRQHIELLNRVNNDVLSTLWTRLRPFAAIAAAWQEKELVSLTRWRDDTRGSVLVLCTDPEAGPATTALNQVLFARLSQVLLGGPENLPGRPEKITYCFFDEFTQMGPLPGMKEFIRQCRSKGGRVILAFQYYADVVKAYGEEIAKVIVGEMQTAFFLGCGIDQGEWQSRTIGTLIEDKFTGNKDKNAPDQKGESWTPHERLTIHPTRFARIPPAGPKDGIGAFTISPYFKGMVYYHATPWKGRVSRVARLVETPDFGPPNVGFKQTLEPWTQDEYGRLELDPALKEALVESTGESASHREAAEEALPQLPQATSGPDLHNGREPRYRSRDTGQATGTHQRKPDRGGGQWKRVGRIDPDNPASQIPPLPNTRGARSDESSRERESR